MYNMIEPEITFNEKGQEDRTINDTNGTMVDPE